MMTGMTVEPIACPCCRQSLAVPSLDIVVDHCKLPPLQARILRAVWQGKGQPVQTEMIIAAMDRGVDVKSHTYNDFKIALHHLRKRMKAVGIRLPNAGYALGYKIVFDAADPKRHASFQST